MPHHDVPGGICLHCERYRSGSACRTHPDTTLADPDKTDVIDVLRAIDARRYLRRLQLGWTLGAAVGAAIVLGAWLRWGALLGEGRLYWFALSVAVVVFIARAAGWYALTTFKLRFSAWTGDKAHMLRGAKLWKRQNQLRRRYRSVADLFK